MQFTAVVVTELGFWHLFPDDANGAREYVKTFKDGQRYTIKITKCRDSKTQPQLGYYYGLLLPEIHKQLVEDGFSMTKRFRGAEMEFPPSMDDSHGVIKGWAAKLNRQDDVKDVGDMDIREMSQFIDGALQVAAQLSMNVEALEAKRPEQENE